MNISPCNPVSVNKVMTLIASPLRGLGLLLAVAAFTTTVSVTRAAEGSGEIPSPKDPPRVVAADPGKPPSDAIVLFDGKDLSAWDSEKGGEPKWEIADGVTTVNGTGGLQTKKEFGDCQIHVEFATPSVVKGEGQGRGNSGVYIMGRYEIQVLDSWNNPTYWHGSAASVYKQTAPLVNVSRKPGEWQVYDIVFHAPRFDEKGALTKAATVTVMHNGVLVQDHTEILGTTSHMGGPKYTAHPAKQPLHLQDHGDKIRYRNLWIREL